MLWELLDAERSNVDRRLAVLVAALVAGGPGADERLFEFLGRGRAMLPERTMAALWIALGPKRARGLPDVRGRVLGPNKEPEELLAIAARLAAARFGGGREGVSTLDSDDPGLLAAAVFAEMPVARTCAEREWRSEHRDAALYRRAAFLSDRYRVDRANSSPRLLDRARSALLQRGIGGASERDAAVLLLAAAGELDLQQSGLDWRQLRIVANQSASAELLRARLQPTPLARDPEPSRLGTAFALRMPVDQVLSSRATWGDDERIRAPIAVALAARLCAEPRRSALDLELAGVPEWAFVRWASGGRFRMEGVPADARLAELAKVVADGRVSRSAAREALELALWRWGSHPGLAAWELERQLIRDLLLVGSRTGGRYAPGVAPHLRYFPAGLDRDDTFFDVAVALYEFTGRRSGPIPVAHRLR